MPSQTEQSMPIVFSVKQAIQQAITPAKEFGADLRIHFTRDKISG